MLGTVLSNVEELGALPTFVMGEIAESKALTDFDGAIDASYLCTPSFSRNEDDSLPDERHKTDARGNSLN